MTDLHERTTPIETQAVRRRGRPTVARRVADALVVLVLPVLLVIVWHFSIILFDIKPYLLPPPAVVVTTLIEGLLDGSILRNGWVTLQEVLLGFVIGSTAGVALAICIQRWRIVERTVYPLVIALQTIPKVALAPLFVMWLGFGMESKVLTAALLAFFPVLVNTITGMKSTDPDRLALMRSLRARPRQVLWMVQLPNALPYMFAGFRIAVVFSVIGAIVGEFVGAQAGLGFMIKASQINLDASTTFAIIIVLAVFGLALNTIVKFAEKRIVFWQRNGSDPIAGV